MYSLRTTADAAWLRSFRPKDAICTALSSLGGEKHLFLNSDQIQKLEVLHQNLPYDCRAQIYIDTYLPCSFLSDASLHEKHKNLTSSLLTSDVVDAPQFGNLPDVCYVIRQSMLRSWSMQEYQNNLKTTRTNSRKTTHQMLEAPLFEKSPRKDAPETPFLTTCVLQCFPVCQRSCTQTSHRPVHDKAAAETKVDMASMFILLNIMLGTLLGVHPFSEWRPGFATRCNLYKRVHGLLTSDEHTMSAFIRNNKTLVQLSVTEYVCSVMQNCMPAETEFLNEHVLPEGFFKQCSHAFDAFRRNVMDDGLEPWRLYNTNACAAVDQYFKLLNCGKLKVLPCKQLIHAVPGSAVTLKDDHVVQSILDTPCLLQRWHSLDEEAWMRLQSEYIKLTRGISQKDAKLRAEQIISVFQVAQFSRIPENLAKLQRSALEKIRNQCEYRAWCRRTKHLCFCCLMKGVETAYRVDSETSQVICNNGCSGCIVGINMIGSILTLKQKRYVFAPCCAKVVEYDEGHCASIWTGTCHHFGKSRMLEPSVKRQARYRCAYCQSPSKTLVPYSFPSLKRVCMVSTYLCKKHTPNGALLKFVYNQEDFEDVCNKWASQHRPWYRRTRLKADAVA